MHAQTKGVLDRADVQKICQWLLQGGEWRAWALARKEEVMIVEPSWPAEPVANNRLHANSIRNAALIFGVYYWSVVFLLSSVVWAVAGTNPWESALGKLVHYSLCSIVVVGISIGMFHWHKWLIRSRAPEDSLLYLFLGSFLFALAAAPVWAGLGFGVYVAFTWPAPVTFDIRDFGYDMVYGGGLLFGWSCLFTNLVFAFELNARAVRLAATREVALAAQMRALRYQVNPHFLFNTLNSIGGLIEEGAATRAERMVASLSTFLRTTLTLDPYSDVPLCEELALQRDYLGIEQERFSDRMTILFEVDEEAEMALVPSLILQPLIENAIKHGVGAAKGRVEIRLSASRNVDRLCIIVENDMWVPPQDGEPPRGTGVGLRNVSERLHARFQERGVFRFGPIDGGRFRASLELPWRTS